MNKRTINEEIPYAYAALTEVGIADNNRKIQKAYQSQIATFGAAITMSSTRAAIAFFADDGGSSVKRHLLLVAITYVLSKKGELDIQNKDLKKDGVKILYDYVSSEDNDDIEKKEEIINASIALKLSMNLYELVK